MNEQDARPEPPAASSPDTGCLSEEGLAHWLVRRAARGAPEALSDRLEEEWLADLRGRPSACSRMRFAIGCCWATQVIAWERAGATPALATQGAGAKVALLQPLGNFRPFSRRSVTLVLVVGLRVALFYGLMVGLHLNPRKMLPSPLQNLTLPQAHPDVSLPPIPAPKLTHSKVDPAIAVVPVFPQNEDRDDDHRRVSATPGDPEPGPREMAPQDVDRVRWGPGAGFPNPDDFYPSAAKRLDEQGMAIVRVCVDAHGRLTSDPTTVRSSGSARLDAGALRLAKAGSGHYRASTEDGRPVNACYPLRVRFELRNRG